MNNYFEMSSVKPSQKIQQAISSLRFELTETAKVQAKFDASQKTPITESVYRVQFLDTISTPSVQGVIDVIREEILLASGLINTKQSEVTAEKQIADAAREIHDKKLTIIAVKKEQNLHKLKHGNTRMIQSILMISAVIIAFIDAGIAYPSFRTAGFSKLQAVAMSSTIFFLLMIATVVAVPWIQNALKAWQRYLRAMLICASVFIVFAGISFLRAEGLNSAADINAGITMAATGQVHYSPWPLLLTSFGLFAGIFIAHLAYHKKQDETTIDDATTEGFREIPQLKREIKELQSSIKKTEKELDLQKQVVRKQYDLFHKLIKRALHIGELAQGVYKRTYTSYTGTVPDFFHVDQHIAYDTDINFFSPEN
jgi:uncharacterized membrane protein YozB (DUF420 family)